jgi:signal transduction histidine kinase
MPGTAHLRTLLQAAALGIVYYLLASPAAQLETPTTLAAIAWPAPACAIAVLWPMPMRQWPVYLLAILAAMLAVGNLDAFSWHTDLGFSAINVFEVALCAWLGQRYVDRAAALTSTASLVRFLALLPLGAMIIVGSLGATLASEQMHTSWWREWRTLLVGNGVAILVLVPALLAWRLPPANSPESQRVVNFSALSGALAVIVTMAACIVLNVSEESQRGVLSLILVSTAIYGGMRSAALTVSIAAVLGVGLTLMNLGPYRLDGADSIWRLQVDIGALAMLTFFVAVATWERRQLAVRLERARRLESLGLLAGGVAHDFNNILGAVSGYAEITEERLPAGSPALPPLREVLSASARGRDLTEQILLAARRGDRVREVLDLHDIVREAAALAAPLTRPGIAIELAASDLALPVAAHRGQLVRALLNLLRNASQAARSRVTVRTAGGTAPVEPMAVGDAPTGLAVWIEVADDGAGIPTGHLAHLFEPFFSTRASGGTGTGLGLAIVAGVAAEHQGGISVDTSPEGTCFRLVLPRAAGEATANRRAHAQAREPADQPGHGETVMLLDDDRALRERCEDWLAELGFEPLGYDNPQHAIERAAAHPDEIQLLLADIDMPLMRGDELASRIREHAPRLPVILCSGSPQLAAIAHASGAVALAKPFDRAALGRAAVSAMKGLP